MMSEMSSAKRIGLVLGPMVAALMLLAGPPDGLDLPAWATAALLAWMAIWWATEPIPIPVTSLLPLAVLPVFGAATPRAVATGYSSPIVLLLMGGFIIAMGIERWQLHRRIALNIVVRVGTAPRALIFGFMVATALLSMWISNSATTLMMVPIANLIMLFVLAFSTWPIQRELDALRRGGQPVTPAAPQGPQSFRNV